MNAHLHDRRCLSPKAKGWWGRLLTAGVFAFYLQYVPIHLATAAHLDGALSSLTGLAIHGHDHHSDHHDQDDHDHAPHPASDHTLTLTSRTQLDGAVAFKVFLQPVELGMMIVPPRFSLLPPVFERVRPPGESPPDPLQPRAPPLA